MGNCSSCCRESYLFSWMFPKKTNLPIKPAESDNEGPKPITPVLEEDAGIVSYVETDK